MRYLRIAVLAALGPAVASTTASGQGAGTPVPPGLVVSETWTKAGSPYRIQGDVQLSVVAIEPGVEVRVDPGFSIEILAAVSAVGTASEPILFSVRDPATERWKGLVFNGTPDGTLLEHCIIEYSDSSGIRLTEAAPTMIECTVRRNSSSTGGAGIDAILTAKDLTLTGCLVYDNVSITHGAGIRAVLEQGTLTLDRCAISRNVADAVSINNLGGSPRGGGVYVLGSATVRNSVISHNRLQALRNTGTADTRGGGLCLAPHGSGNGTFVVSNSVILENACKSNFIYQGIRGWASSIGGGMYLEGGDLECSNTIFGGNEVTSSGGNNGNTRQGAGFFNLAGDARLRNCTMARNGVTYSVDGVYCQGGATTIENTILYFNNPDVGSVPLTYGPQISGAGTVNASYCCIQETPTYPGMGNISTNPVLAGTGVCFRDLRIVPGSLCVDGGDPLGPDDACFLPSLGGSRNDIGAHGGPGACDWEVDAKGISWPVLEMMSGATYSRNGAGSNPSVFTSRNLPVIGETWQGAVDVAPGQFSALLAFAGGPRTGIVSSFGEVLCVGPILGGAILGTPNATTGEDEYQIAIPADSRLVGFGLSMQAVRFTSLTDLQLTNAVDLKLGSF